MKKFLAVLLAVLTVCSLTTVTVYAEEEPAAPVSEEETTVHEQNQNELVVPTSSTQLKFAFVFKVVEKVMKFILGFFGKDLDFALAGGAAGFAGWIEEIVSNLDAGLAE